MTSRGIKEVFLKSEVRGGRNIHLFSGGYECPSYSEIEDIVIDVNDQTLESVKWEAEIVDCDYFATRFYYYARRKAWLEGFTKPYAIGFIAGWRLFEKTNLHACNIVVASNKSVFLIEPQSRIRIEKISGEEYISLMFM